MSRMIAAQAIWEILRKQGIRYIFGNPGTTEISLLDSLAGCPELRFVLGTHETAVVAMADGYARLGEKPGVVLIHSVPGTCNAMGSLYTAFRYGTPLVIMAGQQDTRLLIDEPTLSADLVKLASNFAKYAYEARHAAELPRLLVRAISVACTPPTGPVYLSLPLNVARETIEFSIEDFLPVQIGIPQPDQQMIEKAAALLQGAKHPVIIAGKEVTKSGAVQNLVALAEFLGCAVFPEPMLRTVVYPTDHPLYSGGGGLERREVSDAVKQADVVVAVGCPLFLQHAYAEGALIPKGVKLIHIHPDSREIDKIYRVEVPIPGDPKSAINSLLQRLKEDASTESVAQWKRRGEDIGLRNIRRRTADVEELKKQEFSRVPVGLAIKAIRNVLPAESIIIDESVRASPYVRAFFDFSQPNTYFSHETYLGWGLGAAAGIKLARPDVPVAVLIGDGSFVYGMHALYTMAQESIPVTVIVLNNNHYLAVKRGLWANKGPSAVSGRFVGVELNADITGMARGFGIPSVTVERLEQVAPEVEKASKSGGPWVVEVMVDPLDPGFKFPRLL